MTNTKSGDKRSNFCRDSQFSTAIDLLDESFDQSTLLPILFDFLDCSVEDMGMQCVCLYLQVSINKNRPACAQNEKMIFNF
jgi:hypothetical protein